MNQAQLDKIIAKLDEIRAARIERNEAAIARENAQADLAAAVTRHNEAIDRCENILAELSQLLEPEGT